MSQPNSFSEGEKDVLDRGVLVTKRVPLPTSLLEELL